MSRSIGGRYTEMHFKKRQEVMQRAYLRRPESFRRMNMVRRSRDVLVVRRIKPAVEYIVRRG